jgi:hypothetical protein
MIVAVQTLSVMKGRARQPLVSRGNALTLRASVVAIQESVSTPVAVQRT